MITPSSCRPSAGDRVLSRERVRQTFDIVLKHTSLPLKTLLALRGANSDICQVASYALQSAKISSRFPLRNLKSFANLQSLFCQGSYDPKTEWGDLPTGLYPQNSTLARVLSKIEMLIWPYFWIVFEIKRYGYGLRGGQLRDGELHHLCQLSNLAHLRLEHLRFITDTGLYQIGRLRGLRSLSLRHCPNVSGSRIGHLRSLSRLEVIDLTGQRPWVLERCGALSALTNLPKLQEVRFGALSTFELKILFDHPVVEKIKRVELKFATSQALSQLAQFTRLEEFILRSTAPNFAESSTARGLKDLHRLRTFRTMCHLPPDFLSTAFRALETLPSLTSVNLLSVEKEALSSLMHLTQLENLSMGCRALINATSLSLFPKLRVLSGQGLSIRQGEGWRRRSPLQTLNLNFCSFTVLSLTTLRNLPNLTSLNLEQATLPGNFTLKHLANFESLEKLNLNFVKIKSRFQALPRLAVLELPVPLPSLTHLSLRGWSLMREQFDFIAQLPRLAQLDLTEAQYSEEDLSQLKSAVSGSPLRILESKVAAISKGGFWRRAVWSIVGFVRALLGAFGDYLRAVLTLRA